ncbi:MAG: hypothetical protein AABZ32_03105 [Bacteroidota bacterium]
MAKTKSNKADKGLAILMKQANRRRKVSRDSIFAKLIDEGMKSENVPLKKLRTKLRNNQR